MSYLKKQFLDYAYQSLKPGLVSVQLPTHPPSRNKTVIFLSVIYSSPISFLFIAFKFFELFLGAWVTLIFLVKGCLKTSFLPTAFPCNNNNYAPQAIWSYNDSLLQAGYQTSTLCTMIKDSADFYWMLILQNKCKGSKFWPSGVPTQDSS